MDWKFYITESWKRNLKEIYLKENKNKINKSNSSFFENSIWVHFIYDYIMLTFSIPFSTSQTLIKTDESKSHDIIETICCSSHKSLSRGNMSHLKRLFPPRHNQWHRTRWLPQLRVGEITRNQTKQDRKLLERQQQSIFIQFPVDLTANSLVESSESEQRRAFVFGY